MAFNAHFFHRSLVINFSPLSPIFDTFKNLISNYLISTQALKRISILQWNLGSNTCMRIISEAHTLSVSAIAVSYNSSVFSGKRGYFFYFFNRKISINGEHGNSNSHDK